MNEETKVTNEVETPESFDPTTLPKEALEWFAKEKERYADSRVTGAVKKATDRVKSEMANDAELRAKIRQEVEYEATLTAEDKVRIEREKVEAELKHLKKESNAFLVKKELISYGFDDTAIERLAGLVVTDDKDTTMAKLKELTDTFKSTLTAQVEKEKLSLLSQAGKPPAGGSNSVSSEKADYKAQFIAAKQAKDEVAAARIIRESQAKGIDIFR